MWKDRHSAGHKDAEHTVSEKSIDSRDKGIRDLIDELVSGTQELKSLYTGETNVPRRSGPDPAQR